MTNEAFSEAAPKFLQALRYRCPGQIFEYLKVNEWRRAVQYAHVLLRVRGRISRRAVREAKRVAGVRCSVKPVKNVVGVANYLFKHTKRPERKAELTPATFRGRMYSVTKGFLTMPFKDLWREARLEPRRHGRSG